MNVGAVIRCQVCGGSMDHAVDGQCPACGVVIVSGRKAAAAADPAGPHETAESLRAEISAARAALDVDPRSSLAWHRIGLAFEQLRLPRNAEQAYETALSLMPENTIIRHDLAALQTELGAAGDRAKSAAAARQAQRIVEIEDDPVAGRIIMARLAVQGGDFVLAREAISRTASFHPKDAQRRIAWINLAEAHAAIRHGHPATAPPIWEHAATIDEASTRANALAFLAAHRTIALEAARRIGMTPERTSTGSPPALRRQWTDETDGPIAGVDIDDGEIRRARSTFVGQVAGCLTILLFMAFIPLAVGTWHGFPFLMMEIVAFMLLLWFVQRATGVNRAGHGQPAAPRPARRVRGSDVGILRRLESPETPIRSILAVAGAAAGRLQVLEGVRTRRWVDAQPVSLPPRPIRRSAR